MALGTILIVEDSPTVAKLASVPLQKAGYRVLFAGDGDVALALARRDRPDLILLDIILPRRNGFQVCRELKAESATRSIKILLLSSKSNESDRFWGLRQGADGYMTKPFEDSDLLEAVEALLDASSESVAS